MNKLYFDIETLPAPDEIKDILKEFHESRVKDGKEKKSFELMRSISRDVDVVTFDEVLEKIKGLEKLLFGDKKDIKAN